MFNETLLKRFDAPDETREFELGKFEIVKIGGMTIGRATYQPGWKWSQHVAPLAGTRLCELPHIGLVLEGQATVAIEGQDVITMTPGTLFEVPALPHDSWVVGDQPYVSLHFMGAEAYAK